jgi:hypothetical protein
LASTGTGLTTPKDEPGRGDSTVIGVFSQAVDGVATTSRSIRSRDAIGVTSPGDDFRSRQTSLLQLDVLPQANAPQAASGESDSETDPFADWLYSMLEEASEGPFAHLDGVDDEPFSAAVDAAIAMWAL